MATRKYKPEIGDEIEFYIDKEKQTGTIDWMGSKAVSVFPHSVVLVGSNKEPLGCGWFVNYDDIIGEKADV